MSRPKIGAIGVLIFVALILNVISVFTKNWIVVSYRAYGASASIGFGLSGDDGAGWFAAASWMMYISFGVLLVLALLYLYTGWKVHHHGCCYSIRPLVLAIGGLCSLTAFLQALAFILVVANVSSSYSSLLGTVGSSVGSSGYLALSSAIVLIVAMSLAAHVAHHHCR
uniref:Uncharacterized protein n=1 Tax=Caenorhabditis japonica TaxID=281687 RepID=A0A8R1DQW3_CAEJA